MSCLLRSCDTFWTLPRPHLAWPSLSLIGAAWRALPTHLSHLHHRVFLAKKHVYQSKSDGKHDFAMSICSELMLLICHTTITRVISAPLTMTSCPHAWPILVELLHKILSWKPPYRKHLIPGVRAWSEESGCNPGRSPGLFYRRRVLPGVPPEATYRDFPHKCVGRIIQHDLQPSDVQ